MQALEMKIPPVVVASLVAVLMLVVARYWPGMAIPGPVRLAAICTLLPAGALFGIGGVVSFRRAGTTVNPLDPDLTTSLVTSGIYRYSRNPMYVGIQCCLLAFGFFLSSPPAIFASAVFVLYINRFQIRPEEDLLAEKFGEQYRDYRSIVRRWL
jgi:protein-S-isoprenylcysteine O-methyltransferase Ste14